MTLMGLVADSAKMAVEMIYPGDREGCGQGFGNNVDGTVEVITKPSSALVIIVLKGSSHPSFGLQ